MTANQITSELLIEIPRRFPNITVWRNNRVDAMAVGRGGKMRRVSAGIDGQADLSGIAGPDGRRIECEIKAGRDRLRPGQHAFAAMIRRHGGIYIEVRSVEDAIKRLEAI